MFGHSKHFKHSLSLVTLGCFSKGKQNHPSQPHVRNIRVLGILCYGINGVCLPLLKGQTRVGLSWTVYCVFSQAHISDSSAPSVI